MKTIRTLLAAWVCLVPASAIGQGANPSDEQQYQALARSEPTTCRTIEQLREMSAQKPEPWRAKYQKLAESKRVSELSRLLGELKEARRMVGDLDDPDGRENRVALLPIATSRMRQTVEQMKCYDADVASRVGATTEKEIARLQEQVEKQRAEEAACQASPKCMNDRAIAVSAASLCQLYDNLANLRASLAAEKANPSGVVNLAELNSIGADIQATQAQIKEGLAEYKTLAHKPFAKSACRASAPR